MKTPPNKADLSLIPDPRFLKSSLCTDSPVFPLAGFDDWFARGIARHRFDIQQIPFAALDKWGFDSGDTNLRHVSGKFFSIEGVTVQTTFAGTRSWSQPIINQPEVGFLGLIAKEIDGVLHFLMQAKMEPGNINMIQLAPTLQATRSNYMRVHQGKSPPFLEYFRDNPSRRVLVDVLQSEQGGRFLRKRNRNIIIEVPLDQELPASEDYLWLTLGQISRLLNRNNVINMDARTVLSCISYHRCGSAGSGSPKTAALHTEDEILAWFTEMKCRFDLQVCQIPLAQVERWNRDEMRIFHETGNYFEVIAVKVEADNREVPAWTQPLIKPCREGLIALVMKMFGEIPHFLIQAKVEPGNFDVVEMAPTVQCLTGNYKRVAPEQHPPFLDYVLTAPKSRILYDTLQSEEGGRFFREENRNLIVLADEDLPSPIPDNYIWVSYEQLKTLIRFNNFVNIQCRCLLSACGAGAQMASKIEAGR